MWRAVRGCVLHFITLGGTVPINEAVLNWKRGFAADRMAR